MLIPDHDEFYVAGMYAAILVGIWVIGEVRHREAVRAKRCVACWFNPCRCRKDH